MIHLSYKYQSLHHSTKPPKLLGRNKNGQFRSMTFCHINNYWASRTKPSYNRLFLEMLWICEWTLERWVTTRKVQCLSPWQRQVDWGQRTLWRQGGGLPADQSDCLVCTPQHSGLGSRWSLRQRENGLKNEHCLIRVTKEPLIQDTLKIRTPR